MGWGTSYKYNGYLSRISKSDIREQLEEQQSLIDMYWRELAGYANMTPPVYAESEEGTKYPWVEYLGMTLARMRTELEESYRLKAHLEDCLTVLEEHPENVHDPNDDREALLGKNES